MSSSEKSYLAHLRTLERKHQAFWEQRKMFEADTPADYNIGDAKKKFFVTFPFPYMNGQMHLGHLFSMTKADFSYGFHRMMGDNTLFPFGFHVTGMPICGAAKKLAAELEAYGCPPVVPEDPAAEDASEAPVESQAQDSSLNAVGVFKSRKSKTTRKATGKLQYEILRDLGIPEADIPKFVDPYEWVYYFPKHCVSDMKSFGARVDWRRSFFTTDANPYFNAFVEWQFNFLRDNNYLKYGSRNCIWSPLDNQPCMDHDRTRGEGVLPQDYLVVKLELLNPSAPDAYYDDAACVVSREAVASNQASQALFQTLRGAGLDPSATRVFLGAATLRAETMVGQTNCWVLPTGSYGVYRISPTEAVVMSERAALNMAYQELNNGRPQGQTDCVCTLSGEQLINTIVYAPLSEYRNVYVLPLLTIKMDKGTGIVTSVPSDAPDDYQCWKDLQSNYAGIRDRYRIDVAREVAPFQPLPIIDIADLGTCAAARLCEERQVSNQHDASRLADIKHICYTKGFYEGTMARGPFAGRPIAECKQLCKELLQSRGDAFTYAEPESEVVARSGCACVVAKATQWFICYGEEEWKQRTELCLDTYINTYHEETHNQFKRILDWFREWACSRTFGLGTRLPWDAEVLIESLSDSTIYNAYYTIDHFFQLGTLDGSILRDVLPAALLDGEFFSYVLEVPIKGLETQARRVGASFVSSTPPRRFVAHYEQDPAAFARLLRLLAEHGTPVDPAAVKTPVDLLDAMRRSFDYWYPVDLRCSGKDLVPNHLTMMMYNHTAVWRDDEAKWPRGFRANGLLMVDDEKMSKSLGNFLTAIQTIERYGADATRFALADAGDGLEDANFRTETADQAVVKLFNLLRQAQEILGADRCTDRQFDLADVLNPANVLLDGVFNAYIDDCVHRAVLAFDKCLFREGLLICFNELARARDSYTRSCGLCGLLYARGLVRKYLEAQAKLLAVICPHVAEELFRVVLGNEKSVFECPLPSAEALEGTARSSGLFMRMQTYVNTVTQRFRTRLADIMKPRKDGSIPLPNGASAGRVYVAQKRPQWQSDVAGYLREMYVSSNNALLKDAIPRVREHALRVMKVENRAIQQIIKYAAALITNVKTDGIDALVTELPFDEKKVLSEYSRVIAQSLNLQSVDVHMVGEGPDGEGSCKASSPGKPIILFS